MNLHNPYDRSWLIQIYVYKDYKKFVLISRYPVSKFIKIFFYKHLNILKFIVFEFLLLSIVM